METARTIVRAFFQHNVSQSKRRIGIIPLRSIQCDTPGQLFLLAMSGHAGPIQIAFGVTPVVDWIPCGQATALSKGRRACCSVKSSSDMARLPHDCLLKETSRGSVYSEDLPPPTLSAFANRPFCDGHHIGLTTCATRARGRANFCEPVWE